MNDSAPGKILVTGGKGNLGSWIVRDLKQQGHEVWTLSRARYNEDEFHFAVDLTDSTQCAVLKDHEFDGVIHTASINNGSLPDFAYKALHINAFGTNNLLNSLNHSRLKHFIYMSTFHAYGIGHGKVDENTAPTPKNDYGLTHYFAEQYVRKYHATESLPFSIIRLTNSYGCPTTTDSIQWSLLFNDLARMALEQKKLVLRSSGEARRDFVWMGDVCSVLSQLITRQATNDIFNLSRGSSLRLLDIALQIQAAYSEVYDEILTIQKESGDGSDSPDLAVNNEKIKTVVNFNPQDMYKQEAKNIFAMLSPN